MCSKKQFATSLLDPNTTKFHDQAKTGTILQKGRKEYPLCIDFEYILKYCI